MNKNKYRNLDSRIRVCDRMISNAKICIQLIRDGLVNRMKNEYAFMYKQCGSDIAKLVEFGKKYQLEKQECLAEIKRRECCPFCSKKYCESTICQERIQKSANEPIPDEQTSPRSLMIPRSRKLKQSHFINGEPN